MKKKFLDWVYFIKNIGFIFGLIGLSAFFLYLGTHGGHCK